MNVKMNVKGECCVCEGVFSTREIVIEDDGKLYCEACHKEDAKNGI